MTVCGCFSALLIPMPFIFYFFGKRIRAKSKFAPAPDLEQDSKRRDEEAGGATGQINEEHAEAPNVGMTSSDESTSEKKSVPQ
jgi:DHA1 family multidrug resistance protein-like MFS transporter